LAVILGQIFANSVLRLRILLKPGLGIRLDRVDRTFRLANAAVDALVGMNDEHVGALVEAVHRAHFHAIHVLAFNATFDDDVSHYSLSGRAAE
jgi:hypothetical protein